jgi:hypothetical protein
MSLALAACPKIGAPNPPDIACTPTVAGVVESVERGADEDIYLLQDGDESRVPQRALRHFGPQPNPGDLLLYGESEECGPFIGRAVSRDRPSFPGCLGIAEAAVDDGDHVLLVSGLRLPKGAGFATQASYGGMRGGLFCLNEQGEVLFFE